MKVKVILIATIVIGSPDSPTRKTPRALIALWAHLPISELRRSMTSFSFGKITFCIFFLFRFKAQDQTIYLLFVNLLGM